MKSFKQFLKEDSREDRINELVNAGLMDVLAKYLYEVFFDKNKMSKMEVKDFIKQNGFNIKGSNLDNLLLNMKRMGYLE